LELEIILIARLPAELEWDFDRYVKSKQKQKTEKYFTGANLGLIAKPTTVVDLHGKILMWYLPGLLLPHRVVRSTAPARNLSFLLTLYDSKS
jgi:hypothetical protein